MTAFVHLYLCDISVGSQAVVHCSSIPVAFTIGTLSNITGIEHDLSAVKSPSINHRRM